MSTINLAELPRPEVIQVQNAEELVGELLQEFVDKYPDTADVIDFASEPIVKFLDFLGAKIIQKQGQDNDRARANMIAFAEDSDLDNLVAFADVKRRTLVAVDPDAVPPIGEVRESDDALRQRYLLTIAGSGVAGSEDQYKRVAIDADIDVRDVSVISPTPNVIELYILSHSDDGSASQALIDTVLAAASAKDARPIGDNVSVHAAAIVDVTVTAELVVSANGPDSGIIRGAAIEAVNQYGETLRALGRDVALSGIYRALHQEGVDRVNLTMPATDQAISPSQSARLAAINITVVSP
jgi:phage-related baseplate assembly protein